MKKSATRGALPLATLAIALVLLSGCKETTSTGSTTTSTSTPPTSATATSTHSSTSSVTQSSIVSSTTQTRPYAQQQNFAPTSAPSSVDIAPVVPAAVEKEPLPQPPSTVLEQKLPSAPPATAPYKNCTAVWNALGHPIRAGEPGFGAHLDRDNDGIGCERRPK